MHVRHGGRGLRDPFLTREDGDLLLSAVLQEIMFKRPLAFTAGADGETASALRLLGGGSRLPLVRLVPYAYASGCTEGLELTAWGRALGNVVYEDERRRVA